ncbi:EAL domain-containing protein [Paroceanicella profunda]|uniref:EAL domain-containing protein n=1 Tax=Paroceanicella profunda TaxID=2579971 RepID=A0A5B8FZF8_9RHOB|nr:GGDEF domain-containing phosphodiesterase [Paroceanicella profunda]QDL92149.1 EAL domain-containing protein [Paroceanicella profunda]
MTHEDGGSEDGATPVEVLEGFGVRLYEWDLGSDAMRWMGAGDAVPDVPGLGRVSCGLAFSGLRADGAERVAWALRARAGETRSFRFAVPSGPVTLAWFEDTLRRQGSPGSRRLNGMLRRIPPPRADLGLQGSFAPAHPALSPAKEARAARARLREHLATAPLADDRYYVVVGVDNLRDLNRALGADVTDEIIEEVFARIARSRPDRVTCARVAGSKVGLAVSGVSPEEVTQGLRAVMASVGRQTIETGSGPVAVTVSAGVSHTPCGATLPEDPLAEALVAFDEGRFGRIEALQFARGDHGQSLQRNRITSSARLVMDALVEDRIALAFQPVVRAGSSGTVAFHECLARILDANGAEIPAGSFMPAIVNLGLVRQVDRAVLRHALEALRKSPTLRLSVNLSPQSMQDADWLALLEAAAATAPDTVERLILEITESSAIIDPLRTLDFMSRVRDLGCAFALDDFGAGYTSFRHFRDFRFDVVKIDGSFVRGISASEDNQILVRTLVSIADHFSMFTVAECVETAEDAARLTAMGVDCLQGYHFGRPSIRKDWYRSDDSAAPDTRRA